MNNANWTEIFTFIAAIATALGTIVTAVGVILAWHQIKASKQLNQIQFEDNLTQEFREIILQIPVEALLGEKLEPKEQRKALRAFYHYIDLTNEQIFLRQKGRVGLETWQNWRDGIKSLMTMPAFSESWSYIKQHPTTKFEELRRLEANKFQDDPYEWSGEKANSFLSNATSEQLLGANAKQLS